MEKFKTAVILAGGKSSRMGFDKQFLEIKNQRLLEIIISKLKQEFEEIIIVTNKPEDYQDSECKIVCDEIKESGPLSGIHIGLKESSSEYVYFVGCDMPNINLDYIRYMKESIKKIQVEACVTRVDNNIEPFNAFYSKSIIAKIENQISSNKKSLCCFVDSINTYYIEKEASFYSLSGEMFINLNTKEELDIYTRTIKSVQ